MITEEEAKTKWCPHARCVTQIRDGFSPALVIANGGNRLVTMTDTVPLTVKEDEMAGCKCIGSACMAWREETTTTARHKPGYGPVIETAATGGYCGLAGKP